MHKLHRRTACRVQFPHDRRTEAVIAADQTISGIGVDHAEIGVDTPRAAQSTLPEVRIIYRHIADESEIELLASLSEKTEASTDWVTGLLDRGESRPEWCRMAFSDAGELVAAHVFDSWSPAGDPGPTPASILLLGHSAADAAADLLTHDLTALDVRSVDARIVIEYDAPAPLRALRESQPAIVQAAGFELDVDRVRLRWPFQQKPQQPKGILTFRPESTMAPDTVERIFAEVADESVDNWMRRERAEHGRQQEAAQRLDIARNRDYPDDWFVIGFNENDEPVGYVQSATGAPDRAILAEIGVVAAQRGHRYVDELLAYGTTVIVDSGARMLTSDTDQANRAMRAAFARGGYEEFASRHDFHWKISTS
jgi:hypothetical protein